MFPLLAALLLSAASAAPMDWTAAGDEAVRVLSAYLRVDTRNPGGSETLGARFLQDQLAAEGISSEIHEFAPGRGSLVARLPGSGAEPPLCLLSHIDVVPFEAERWPVDAGGLSGVVKDGAVWGRGALDMKGMGVLELQTMLWLKRNAVPLRRDVILLAVADEEVGGGGARLLAERHWKEIGCSQLVNEGGLGLKGLFFEGQTVYGISVAEKGTLWVHLSVEGPAGHGSRPDPTQAPARLTRALARLEAWRDRPTFHPALLELFDAVGAGRSGVERLVLRSPLLVRTLLKPRLMAQSATRAAITDTINVTGFAAGNGSVNVVPSEARATLDCRLLPGTTPAQMEALLRDIIADDGIRLEIDEARSSNESPTDDSLYRALAARAVEGRPDAVAGPIVSVGFTDSIYLRPLGVRAYGFVPFEITLEEAETMHGHGERVSVENVRNGLRILYNAVVDVVAAK